VQDAGVLLWAAEPSSSKDTVSRMNSPRNSKSSGTAVRSCDKGNSTDRDLDAVSSRSGGRLIPSSVVSSSGVSLLQKFTEAKHSLQAPRWLRGGKIRACGERGRRLECRVKSVS